MKKLLTLLALVGMGAFMAGCEEKSAAPPAGGTVPMTGPGSVGQPPKQDAGTDKATEGNKEGEADKGDADKADADKDKKEE